MDLNHLYYRQGMSHLLAQDAACERSRRAHLARASAYTRRIADVRRQIRALAA
jgi:hypothetical protein